MARDAQAIERQDVDPARALYGSLVDPLQLVYPTNPLQISGLLHRIQEHADLGGHVAIVDGAYDVPHDGHPWYLRSCRVEATRARVGEAFDEASPRVQIGMVASEQTMLIVTLDADAKVAANKSGAEKGGISRPVYPWESRANRIAGYMIPDGNLKYRPTVDVVTVEGDPMHAETPLASHISFGESLSALGVLGTWLVYGEHSKAAEAATRIAGPDVVRIVPQSSVDVIDPRTGRKWSSSDIITRMKGENV